MYVDVILISSHSEQVLMNKLKYEDSLNFEEERLCAAIERLQTDTVVCPVCKMYVLNYSQKFFSRTQRYDL